MITPKIQQTPNLGGQPQVNFRPNDFDAVIYNKGYDVVHEKVHTCSCRSDYTAAQSICENCGGLGYFWINPVQTKMILHSMSINVRYKEWSKENIGNVSISARSVDKLANMDRITMLDGFSVFTEVLFINVVSNRLIAFTTYNVLEVEEVFLFVNTNEKLQLLQKDVDYSMIEGNLFLLDDKYNDHTNIRVSIRYSHHPAFYVVDIGRDIMSTPIFAKAGSTKRTASLPISAVGRRAHYVLSPLNRSYPLIDNSYDVVKSCNSK